MWWRRKRGARVSAGALVQHTKWMEEAVNIDLGAPIDSLNILLTATDWRNDHNGLSHQGPGLIDVGMSKRGSVARIHIISTMNA